MFFNIRECLGTFIPLCNTNVPRDNVHLVYLLEKGVYNVRDSVEHRQLGKERRVLTNVLTFILSFEENESNT